LSVQQKFQICISLFGIIIFLELYLSYFLIFLDLSASVLSVYAIKKRKCKIKIYKKKIVQDILINICFMHEYIWRRNALNLVLKSDLSRLIEHASLHVYSAYCEWCREWCCAGSWHAGMWSACRYSMKIIFENSQCRQGRWWKCD